MLRFLALSLALLLPALADASGGTIRRFALVAGANDGGAARTELRYAASDAAAVARVLEELGGVAPADRLLLVDPDRAGMQAGLAEMQHRLAAARAGDTRVELFVYYSGHSDEEGLLLGEEHFTYGELRQALESLPADVRVAILDSCSSGALTRRKGGVRRAPFLVDAASKVKGHAYLTSSSADEAAQESDRIGASFFTHFLVSGLRGAADSTRDGKVTLTEAYQFAFAETLARTEKTSSGAQHPAYEMQLVGTGDLVMTDLRSTAAGLVVEESIHGRIYVRDAAGALVVELRKAPATPVELGLAPGAYVVTVEDRGSLSEANVVLAEGKRSTLARAQLRSVEGERNRVRGDDAVDESEYVRAPFVLGLVPGSSTLPYGVPEDRVTTGIGFNLVGGRTARLDGVDVGFGLNWHTERASGAMLAIGGNLVGGDTSGAQFAVGFNHTGGSLDGVQASVGYNGAGEDVSLGQAAVGANFAGGDVRGFQASAGANWAEGAVAGAQLTSGLNVARGGLRGVQGSSGVNWVAGDASGFQATAGANVVDGGLVGAQLGPANVLTGASMGLQAGVANWSRASFSGLQLGGGFSWARELEGAQIGVINVGGNVDGAQIGVINVASGTVNGTQIGVVNYADEVDAPLGVLSVVRKGRFNLDLWADETSAGNLGLKIGARHFYGIFTAGVGGRETSEGDQRWTAGLGFGGHVPVGNPALSFLNLELLARQVHYGSDWSTEAGENHLVSTLRLGAGWQIAERFALVAGPSVNVSVAETDRGGFGLFGEAATVESNDEATVRMWPGFFVGVQI